MGLFNREPTAPWSLANVAAERGFELVNATAADVLPPTHRAVDLHGSIRHRSTRQEWWVYTGLLAGGRPARVSLLAIHQNDTEEHVYEMVTWTTPPLPDVALVEVQLANARGMHSNHRLTDRWPSGGHVAIELAAASGRVLVPRVAPADRTARIAADAAWAEVDLTPLGRRPGLNVEVVGSEVCVFTYLGMQHRGPARWHALLSAADTVVGVIDRGATGV